MEYSVCACVCVRCVVLCCVLERKRGRGRGVDLVKRSEGDNVDLSCFLVLVPKKKVDTGGNEDFLQKPFFKLF